MAPIQVNTVFAERLGISKSMASRMLNGYRFGSSRHFLKIHELTGTPLEDILEMRGRAQEGDLYDWINLLRSCVQ